jgi:hypothetical protein
MEREELIWKSYSGCVAWKFKYATGKFGWTVMCHTIQCMPTSLKVLLLVVCAVVMWMTLWFSMCVALCIWLSFWAIQFIVPVVCIGCRSRFWIFCTVHIEIECVSSVLQYLRLHWRTLNELKVKFRDCWVFIFCKVCEEMGHTLVETLNRVHYQ